MKVLSNSSILILVGSLFAVSALAQEGLAPEVKLENGISAIVEIIFDESADATIEAKRDRIVSTLDAKLTFNYIIRRTLGENWSKLSPDQQRDFARLVTDLLLRSYTKKLKKEYKPVISFGAPVELTKLRVEIPSRVKMRNKEVLVAYRMAKLKSGWEVYDIYVRGVSLSQNYKSQFREHFLTRNAALLIQLLEDKLSKR